MGFVEKVKMEANKAWNWIKKHPGETCMAIGTAIIGGVAGSKIGTHKGHKAGLSEGWEDHEHFAWEKHCKTYGWDPTYTKYDYQAMCAVNAPIGEIIKRLQEKDPESTMSGKFVYDATVKPGYEEEDK